MENKNNGRGIFYGVMGVATLVVAIIGATFAYFAAGASQGQETISATSSKVQGLKLTEHKNFKTDLVPVHGEDPKFKDFAALDKCVDLAGNNICSVYEVNVENPNNSAIDATFSLTSVTNTFANLYFTVYKGTANTGGTNNMPDIFTNGAPFTGEIGSQLKPVAEHQDEGASTEAPIVLIPPTKLTNAETVSLNKLDHLMAAHENPTYTIVLWLQETGENQTTDDAGETGKSFSAIFKVDTGSTAGGITGVLATSA